MSHIIIEVDQAVGSAYIALGDAPVARTIEREDGILVDLDEFGVATGIELPDQHMPVPFADLVDRYHVRSDVVDLLRMIRPDVASFVTVTSAVEGALPVEASASGGAVTRA